MYLKKIDDGKNDINIQVGPLLGCLIYIFLCMLVSVGIVWLYNILKGLLS